MTEWWTKVKITKYTSELFVSGGIALQIAKFGYTITNKDKLHTSRRKYNINVHNVWLISCIFVVTEYYFNLWQVQMDFWVSNFFQH